ncbi:small metal-binding protein [Nitrosomonas sp. Nm84]|uniref:small metal-binding protein SmbP n=1 Tax=Nitrosomonas sp. Nm84 TaxID=200124 RepID=UPI000D7619BE|nr:small metal-binding protein SmbP [Nitrosomonas sp. Nm84]PXW89844.1 small metal-binding protein [Nitrosomonas sp. Nm84]
MLIINNVVNTMLYLSVTLIFLFFLSACRTENHLHQAIKYSEAAVLADNRKIISKHLELAKFHALSTLNQKNMSSADRIHLAVGIVSLDQAIENGILEADDSSRRSARVAMAHFKEITP